MKQKIKYIIFAGLLGLFIGFLYNSIVIPYSYKKEMFIYKDSIKLRNSKCINKTYIIPYRETLRLKIVSLYKRKTIIFNNRVLIPYKRKKYSRKLKNLFAKTYYSKPVDYVLIPKDIVNVGKNFLKLSFPQDIRDCVTIKTENYHRNTNNQIFVLFKDSHILPLKRRPIAYLFFVLIILSVFLFLFWKTKIHIYSKFLVSLLPANILLLLACIIPAALDLRLLVTSSYFWILQAVLSALTCFIFFYNYNKKIISENIKGIYSNVRELRLNIRELRLNIRELNVKLGKKFSRTYSFLVIMIIIIIRCLKYLHSRVILPFCQWLKTKPFSEKCVILFMFLLIACALLLISHLEIAAERAANIAYFALCLGVIIKFVQLVRDKNNS